MSEQLTITCPSCSMESTHIIPMPAGTIITETICPYPSPSDDTVINYGVWFQSAATGLWYQNKDAAGTVSAVKVDGLVYSPPTEQKP